VTLLANKDPHFAVPLSTGQQLCYSMQELAGFIFNLISHSIVNLNAYFITPQEESNLIMVQHDHCMGECQPKHVTKITISASDRSVFLDGSRTVISDRPIHVTVDNSTTTIQLGEVTKGIPPV